MPNLDHHLVLDRCPHCAGANPLLREIHRFESDNHRGTKPRKWRVYVCSTCGGAVTAWASNFGQPIGESFPTATEIDAAVPERAKAFLKQAQESLHAPAGAVMLCASAVDAMLKAKELTEGSLYTRIEQAASEHLITADMATWAHEVRLDANGQRHADEAEHLPEQQDAARALDFAKALAEFLFILPSRVQRGLQTNG